MSIVIALGDWFTYTIYPFKPINSREIIGELILPIAPYVTEGLMMITEIPTASENNDEGIFIKGKKVAFPSIIIEL